MRAFTTSACLLFSGVTAVQSVVPQSAFGQTASALSSSFKEVANKLRPSVVSISSTKVFRQERGNVQVPPGFEEFFERYFRGQGGPNQEQRQSGVGTGVIVSKDGYILTNNHVAGDMDELTVTLSNNKEYKAKLVGADPKSDLAVIKIDATGLTPAVLGNSDKLEVGDWVIAMGNAFGLSGTLTAGIVSAKGRANVGIVDYEDFIQTDAAINPGNSGGPLANINAEVVGINTAIFSRSGGSMGIGFAIPSNMAKTVLDSIIRQGRVVRGFLGVQIQNLNEGLASSFKYGSNEGALVSEVSPGGPADKAGFEPGDIITEVNGTKIQDSNHLRNQVAAIAPGSTAKVKIFRDGKTLNKDVRIEELKDERENRRADAAQSGDETAKLGVELGALTNQLRQELGLNSRAQGVVIMNVVGGSRADRAGLVRGDVVTSINNERVANANDVQRLAKRFAKQGLRLRVLRGGGTVFVYIPAG